MAAQLVEKAGFRFSSLIRNVRRVMSTFRIFPQWDLLS